MKEEYVKTLKEKLGKIKTIENEKQMINIIVQDISHYLHRTDNHKYATVQYLVRISLIFKG